MRMLISSSVVVIIFVGLYFTSWISYLLFHTLAEGFSIVVASSMFIIAWNSRKYIRNPYLLFIGIAYLFIAILDLLHALAYKGMPIFTDYDYYANQLWIGARYLESASLILAFVILRQEKPFNVNLIFGGYLLVSSLLVATVFYWKVFPVCFIEGSGLTPFKIVSEYVICGMLSLAMYILRRNKDRVGPTIYRFIWWSIVCTIISELAFTFYVSNYDLSNMIGHYFKILSYLMIYLAIIKTGIEKPFQLIFRDMNRLNMELNLEVEARTRTEREKEELIEKLQHALEEIKTLKGILPICMHCNKIRDEKGSWSRVEAYITNHSDAEFSHGVCPECLVKFYPEYVRGNPGS